MKNIARKYIIVLMAVACVFSTLPFSIGALTPAIEGASYTFVDANGLPTDLEQIDANMTPITGQLSYFACADSPDVDGTVAIDVYSSEITEIGYLANLDFAGVFMKVNLTSTAYIPALSPIPLSTNKQPALLGFIKSHVDPRIVVIASIDDLIITTYVTPDTEVKFTLTEILDTTDMSILNTTLEAFKTELTTHNYVNWMFDGYSNILNVFYDNAHKFYVVDNPFIVISIAVFGTAVLLALCSLIFKFSRR